MTHLIEIYNISGAKVIDKEDGTAARMEARRINIFLDCGSTIKTTILGALALSLYMRGSESEDRLRLLGTMSSDKLWPYRLVRNGFTMIIDGFKVSKARTREIRHYAPSDFNVPTGVRLTTSDDKLVRVLILDADSSEDSDVYYDDNIIDEKYIDNNLSVISFSVQDYMQSDIVAAFSKSVNFAKVMPIVKKILRLNSIYIKSDRFGRLAFYSSFLDADDFEVSELKGMPTLTLLALASSNDVVVVDRVEDQLYPKIWKLMGKIIVSSKSQWFLGTYSRWLLASVLSEIPEETMLFKIERPRSDVVVIDKMRGEEANLGNLNENTCSY
mgnify:CR=1 FL=1